MDLTKCDNFTISYVEAMMWSTTGLPCGDCATCGKRDVLLTHWNTDHEWICRECSENDEIESMDSHYEPSLDDHWNVDDIDQDMERKILADCEAFQRDNAEL